MRVDGRWVKERQAARSSSTDHLPRAATEASSASAARSVRHVSLTASDFNSPGSGSTSKPAGMPHKKLSEASTCWQKE